MKVSAKISRLPDQRFCGPLAYNVVKHLVSLPILGGMEQENHIELLPQLGGQAQELRLDKSVPLLAKSTGLFAGRRLRPYSPVFYQVNQGSTGVNCHRLVAPLERFNVSQKFFIGLDHGTILSVLWLYPA